MIKAILLSLFVALLMVGCGDGIVDYDDLENRNGVTYLADEETPFTGRAEIFHENKQKKAEATFKDGKADGLMTMWYENGHKSMEGNYKDGKRNGLTVRWDEDGTEWFRGTFKNGEPVEN